MSVYKLWNVTRTLKVSVIASSIEDLLDKGSRKLNLNSSEKVTVVLEEDGTEIDEYEILQAFQEKVLLLLLPEEIWTPARESYSSSSSTDQPTIVSPAVSPRADSCINTLSNSSTPMQLSTPSSSASSLNAFSVTEALMRSPLPTFSPMVARHLDGQHAIPERVWNLMIAECANHYYTKWPNMNEHQHYRIIGSTMYANYPSIGLDGENPWSAFTKSLSQKIRHMRFNLKVKSQCTNPSDQALSPPAKRNCFRINEAVTETTQISNEDTERHVSELQREWEKPPKQRNKLHIRKLLKETRHDRVDMLSKATSGTISSLYDKYPCFRDGSYVLYEFGLMFGNERAKLAATNLKNLVLACEGMSSFEHTSWETSDVAQSDIMPALKTKVLESPRIVIFMDGDKVQGIFLVGDTVYTEVKKEGGVLAAVIKLIAMYYIFDMEFPKAYAMVMAVFQTIVLQEVYKRETSAKYKHFMKDLKFQLAEVAHREGQEESEK